MRKTLRRDATHDASRPCEVGSPCSRRPTNVIASQEAEHTAISQTAQPPPSPIGFKAGRVCSRGSAANVGQILVSFAHTAPISAERRQSTGGCCAQPSHSAECRHKMRQTTSASPWTWIGRNISDGHTVDLINLGHHWDPPSPVTLVRCGAVLTGPAQNEHRGAFRDRRDAASFGVGRNAADSQLFSLVGPSNPCAGSTRDTCYAPTDKSSCETLFSVIRETR